MRIDPKLIVVPQHRLDANAAILHSMGITKSDGERLDAGETLAFSRQLEVVQAEIITTDFPALKARQLLPLATDVPPNSGSFVWRRRKAVGDPKWIDNEADDIPEVAASYVEDRSPLRFYGIGYSYGMLEAEAASRLGISLPSDKALDAAEAAERFGDYVAAFGDTDRGIPGFLKAEDTMGVKITPTAGYTLNVATATGLQLLDNLNLFSDALKLLTVDVHEAKRIIIDPRSYSIISLKRVSDTDNRTVLQAWREANPGKEIVSWTHASTASATGGVRWTAYDPDVRKVKLVWPVKYRSIPPQARNMRFVVPGYSEIGGAVIMKPASVLYLDGIVFA